MLNIDQSPANAQSQNVKHITSYSSLYTIFQVVYKIKYFNSFEFSKLNVKF